MPKAASGSPTEPRTWSTVGFLNEFMRIDKQMEDRSFAFLLGAGASVTSGIPAGATLARRWVEELHRLEVGDTQTGALEDWATPENLHIPGFDLSKVAAFYPRIYERRFGDDPDSGYAYLEDEMKSAEPNIGYSVLAQVLENTRHKVVITTNFDNLVADALGIYTSTFPLVCGHESLTGFVKPRLRRPLVAKIHRDLLLAPKSDVESTSKLDERWEGVLKRLLREFTLVVLGYGGNDGSLMGFLDTLKLGDIRGGIYWCYRLEDGRLDERIGSLVAKHKGKVIPIVGFDEFMLQLGERFGYALLDEVIESKAKDRVKRYRDQFKEFQKRLAEAAKVPEKAKEVKRVRDAVATTVGKEKSWWAWELKAQAEKDPDKQEQIYREGVKQFPESADLIGNFALFMKNVRKDYDEAEHLFRRALELDPGHANNTGNFAAFTSTVLKDNDEAERLYRRALDLDPDDARNTGNFAAFTSTILKDNDEAEQLYRRALELDPENARHTGNFAAFMSTVRRDNDEAERLYRRALELDPNDARTIGNFAAFMNAIRKDDDMAELLYRRALELDPNDANTIGNFAAFMSTVRKDNDEAERLYRRALELDSENASTTGNFAIMIHEAGQDDDEAERLFRRALEIDPCHANNTCNFAEFLVIRDRPQEAGAMLQQAWDLCVGVSGKLAATAAFLWTLLAWKEGRQDAPGLARLKCLLEKGFERGAWEFAMVLDWASVGHGTDELTFYQALADAIGDESKVAELDNFERWKAIEPIPIEEPWDMDA